MKYPECGVRHEEGRKPAVSEFVNCEGFYGFFDTANVANPQADLYVIDVDFNRFTVDIATRKVVLMHKPIPSHQLCPRPYESTPVHNTSLIVLTAARPPEFWERFLNAPAPPTTPGAHLPRTAESTTVTKMTQVQLRNMQSYLEMLPCAALSVSTALQPPQRLRARPQPRQRQ